MGSGCTRRTRGAGDSGGERGVVDARVFVVVLEYLVEGGVVVEGRVEMVVVVVVLVRLVVVEGGMVGGGGYKEKKRPQRQS